ncbi:hypothetical protein Poli38472_003748 [Pythium oligandrum]|uniref:Uncharacterized protein n=1 Tax=Pythium oligandrum TaxID=41045 RepID=A0A8K1FPV0_PYTOL|nr:hypothetical protein Poli38472_003748 [Pythium oligandrum]|eukprot:TMW65983.1 hypothetical protein Poli38472_003748 [Pythium oligandrum]
MGNTTSHMTPVPPRWDETQLPDIQGKIVLITGAGTGIGFHTALELARRGAHVVLACHIEAQGRDAEAAINTEIANTVNANAGRAEFMLLDVSSLASVEAFTKAFMNKFSRLDVLVHNAGISTRKYNLSADGYEAMFATNYLGHFALTARLFDSLKQSEDARIIMVSSMLHRSVKFDVNQLMMPESTYDCIQVYRRTKLYMMLFTYEMNRRLCAKKITNVIAVAVHPGIVSTHIMTLDVSDYDIFTRLSFWLSYKVMHTADRGALCTLYAAAMPGVQGGDFYGPDTLFEIYGHPKHCEPSAAALSEEDAGLLWAKSEGLAKLIFDV